MEHFPSSLVKSLCMSLAVGTSRLPLGGPQISTLRSEIIMHGQSLKYLYIVCLIKDGY